MNTAQRISNYLSENGISMAFVADKAQIERQRFYAVLRGDRKMEAEEYFKICRALDKEPNSFMNVGEEGK